MLYCNKNNDNMTYTLDIAAIEKEFGNTGFIIGFANKFYTLWNYSITRNEVTGELTFDAYFVKNIGTTNPYEGAYPFDKGLRGVKIHIESNKDNTGLQLTPQEFKALKFSRGTQRGLVIADYTNLSSLIWKYNTNHVKPTLSEARKKAELTNIANRALELGAVNYEGHLYRKEEIDTTTFSRNPMFGGTISVCEDDNLLCWKYNHHAVNEFRPDFVINGELENIKNRALELGAILIGNRLFSKKDQSSPWFYIPRNLLAACEAGQEIDLEAEHNLDCDGSYNFPGVVTLLFEHKYYPATYYGPEHCYPVDRKGKGKIIRNKVLHIRKVEKLEGDYTVPTFKVIDWDFAK